MPFTQACSTLGYRDLILLETYAYGQRNRYAPVKTKYRIAAINGLGETKILEVLCTEYVKRPGFSATVLRQEACEPEAYSQHLAKLGIYAPRREIPPLQVVPLCPVCGKFMKARKRKNDGCEFWGCTGYPKCRNTLPFSA